MTSLQNTLINRKLYFIEKYKLADLTKVDNLVSNNASIGSAQTEKSFYSGWDEAEALKFQPPFKKAKMDTPECREILYFPLTPILK